MKRYYHYVIALSVVSACQSQQTIDMHGQINQDFLDNLYNQNTQNAVLHISSGGGNIKLAYLASKNLIENKNEVKIEGHCLSACSEYLLAAANEIQFLNYPLVGYHWNTFMNIKQIQTYGGDISRCDLTSVEQQHEIYSYKDLNLDFWKETEKRLNLTYFEVVTNPQACPSKKRIFENHMWFPTSKQLKELLGLKFEGNVCADSPKICQRRIDRRWKSGTRVVLGDTVYVSRGW